MLEKTRQLDLLRNVFEDDFASIFEVQRETKKKKNFEN